MRGRIKHRGEGAGVLPFHLQATRLLGCAVLASGVFLVVLSSRLTFILDEWDFLVFRPGWTTDSILRPHAEHIVVIPVLVYKALLATFGMDSILPFSVAATLVFLVSCVLLFVYLRRRAGDWLALIGTTVILFLGTAWEDLLWPFQIGLFGSMACGLGMLLALEREDRTGDRLACVLLAASMSFSSLGLSFAAGAAVDLFQRRNRWRSRLYVLAIPSLLYAAWWLGWGHTADTSISLHNFGTTPLFVLNALSAGITSLLGLANFTSETAVFGLDWGRPILPIILLLAAWRLNRIREVPRWLWIVAAIGASFWILAALSTRPGRDALASRYQYMSAIFILLIAAELLRGFRVGRNTLVAASAVAATAVLGNVTFLYDTYKIRKSGGELERAVLGAVEIARDTVPPGFTLNPKVVGPPVFVSAFPEGADAASVSVSAAAYLETAADFGSPAYTPGKIAAAPETARVAADKVLAAALGVKLTRAQTPPTLTGPAPVLKGPPTALSGKSAGCLTVRVTGADAPLLQVPPGGVVLKAARTAEAEVRLRRFAQQSLPVDLGRLKGGATDLLGIPTDRSNVPWKLSLQGSGPVTVCGLAAVGEGGSVG